MQHSLELFKTSCRISLLPSHLEGVYFLFSVFLIFPYLLLCSSPSCCFSIPVTLKAARGSERRKGSCCNSSVKLLQTFSVHRDCKASAVLAFKLCLFILLNDHPKSCLEMLNNCCNYPVFLKSFFLCVQLPTDAIHF